MDPSHLVICQPNEIFLPFRQMGKTLVNAEHIPSAAVRLDRYRRDDGVNARSRSPAADDGDGIFFLAHEAFLLEYHKLKENSFVYFSF